MFGRKAQSIHPVVLHTGDGQGKTQEMLIEIRTPGKYLCSEQEAYCSRDQASPQLAIGFATRPLGILGTFFVCLF